MSLSFLLGNIIDPTSFAWNCSGNEICFINTDLLIFVCVCVLIAQSYSTLCDLMDCSLADFSVHGISQARILEWVVISFSRGSSQPRDRAWVTCIGTWIVYRWATWEAHRDYHLAIKRIKLMTHVTPAHCDKRQASYERLHMAWFHLYSLPEKTKPHVQKTHQWFPGAGVERSRLPAKGQEVTSEIHEGVCSLIPRCLHWTGPEARSGFSVISYRRTQMNFGANPIQLDTVANTP